MKRITFAEFKILYKNYIIKDFPRMERRPLASIKKLYKDDTYECIIFEKEERFYGYACLLYAQDRTMALLDYFAIVKEERNSGLGSEFLQLLRKNIHAAGLIIESEMPARASTPEDEGIRARRIAFYLRNGAILSDYEWRAFAVDYHLLWLPGEREEIPDNMENEILEIYKRTLPYRISKKFLSCKRAE